MNISSAPARPPMSPVPNAGSGAPGARAQTAVTVAPSRRELRRADPALSFRVRAPGFTHFDVIVATDPTLFLAAEAHRRTARNFRSSRQDFEAVPIEIETGFYMLPRAFIRDAIGQEPRPGRLHYIAVAYSDPAAGDGVYSVPRDALAEAPYVILGADLSAASLSHVLGMAVHQLGAVGRGGRVMSAQATSDPAGLPRMIGGLPVTAPRRSAGGHGRSGAHGYNGVTPLPRQGGANGGAPANGQVAGGANGAGQGNGAARGAVGINSPSPVAPRGGTASDPGRSAAAPAPEHAMLPEPPEPVGGGFVDDDYAFGGEGRGAAFGFRDHDAHDAPQDGYDDGLGPMTGDTDSGTDRPESGKAAPPPHEPIPPLDETPPPPRAAAGNGDGNGGANGEPSAAPPPPQRETDPAEPVSGGEGWKDTLVQAVIAEGAAGRYEALNLDGAFRGRMGTEHPYYQRAHDGLSLGPHQANQDTGELGELLSLMQSADPASFAQIFGAAAEGMLRVTNTAGPSSLDSPGGRSARVQPVEGRDLWEDPWVDRFRTAARHAPYQAAMRAHIIARRLEPMLPVAAALGFESVRGQAMLLVMAVQSGVAAATTAARAAVNPFDTPAKLAAVLEALGVTDLPDFQRQHGLALTDTPDDPTHFALLSALRALGPEAPVEMPDPETAMDALVTTMGPGPLGDALLKLRVSPNFRQRGE